MYVGMATLNNILNTIMADNGAERTAAAATDEAAAPGARAILPSRYAAKRSEDASTLQAPQADERERRPRMVSGGAR